MKFLQNPNRRNRGHIQLVVFIISIVQVSETYQTDFSFCKLYELLSSDAVFATPRIVSRRDISVSVDIEKAAMSLQENMYAFIPYDSTGKISRSPKSYSFTFL